LIHGETLNTNELIEFLIDLDKTNGSSIPPAVHRIVTTKACRTAIKFGQPLSIEQCRELLQNLSICQFPFQCGKLVNNFTINYIKLTVGHQLYL